MPDSLPLNPYVVGPPVSGSGLYGRQEVFRFVLDTLAVQANRLVILQGQRRVGKTSILQELYQHRLVQAGFCPAFFNAQGHARAPLAAAMHELAATIATVLNRTPPPLAAFESNDNYFLNTFLPGTLASLQHRRLILLIDEFDTLSEDPTAGSDVRESAGTRFVAMMQSLVSDEHWRQVAVVPVIGRRIEDLSPGLAQLCRVGHQYRVWTLPYNETRDLIVKPAQPTVVYEEEAIRAIWNLTSGHPYFVQLLCFEVFNLVRTRAPAIVQITDVHETVNRALEMASAGMTWLWDDLTVAERLIVSAFSEAADTNGLVTQANIEAILTKHHLRLGNLDLTYAIARLVEMRILKHEGEGAYRFEVEMVRRWASKEHPIHLEQTRIDDLSLEAIALYDQAQRIHQAKQFDMAINYYRQALAKNPNHRAAQLGLAQARLDNSDLVGAVSDFEEAVKLGAVSAHSGLIQALLALGEYYERQEQFIEAGYQFRKVLALEPENRRLQEKLEILYDYGRKAMVAKQWAAAVTYFEQVTGIQRDYRDATHQLAEARRRLQPSRWRQLVWPLVVAVLALLLIGGGITAWASGLLSGSTPTPTPLPVVINSATPSPTIEPSATIPLETPEPVNIPTLTPTPAIVTPTPLPASVPPPTEVVPLETPTPLPPSPSPNPPVSTPTLTPTPYPVPQLINPNHQTAFQGTNARPRLEWTSTESLGPDDYYLLRLEFLRNGNLYPYTVRLKSAFWEVSSEIFDLADPPERKIQWRVVTARIPPGDDTNNAIELSPVSETWTFTWEAVPLPAGAGLDVVINRGNNRQVLVVLRGIGIYKSDNGGGDWRQVFSERTIETLHIAPANPQIIYAGAFAQVLKSEDGGETWRAIAIPPKDVQVYALTTDPDNANFVFAATDRGILGSGDGGSRWLALDRAGDRGQHVLDGRFYSIVAARTSQGNRVYVAGEGDQIHKRWANDLGSAWQTEVCGACARTIFALAVDPRNSNNLLAGSDEGRLALSSNAGYSWRPTMIPLPSIPTLKFSALEFDPGDAQTIYAGSGTHRNPSDGEGLYRSQDGGLTWEGFNIWVTDGGKGMYIQGIALNPTNPQTIFIAGSEGVLRSIDGGYSWVKQ